MIERNRGAAHPAPQDEKADAQAEAIDLYNSVQREMEEFFAAWFWRQYRVAPDAEIMAGFYRALLAGIKRSC